MINTVEFQKKEVSGYIIINIDGYWKREHIYVVEEFIGRELNGEEVIHHIDFNKFNNYIDNLVIFPNQKAHSHFHRQIKQFSYTNPRKLEILKLKELMLIEHNKNVIEVTQ